MTQSPQLGNENASLTKLCVTCNQKFSAATTQCPHDQGDLFDLKTDPMFGRRVAGGKYRVLRELGRGGMGAVYLAEDDEGKQVAVKLFKAQLTDKLSATRFQEEAASWLRLQHPHSAALLGNIVEGKQPCLVVEFVHGKSLAVLMKQEGTLSLERCLHIFGQVMDTIQYAHSNGVLHRDLKPGNIVLTNHNDDPDYVKVVDFMVENLSFGSPSNLGLADLVSRGPVYMSPEQCQGKKLTAASDIYSLGIALYEALTGRVPFKGRNSVETASMQIGVAAPPFATANPQVTYPAPVEQVTLRALEKDPYKRFASMAEFKSSLTQAINDPDNFVMPPVQPPPAAPAAIVEESPPETETKLKPNPLPLIVAAAVLLLAIVGGVMVMTKKPTESISFSHNTPGVPNNRVVEGTVYFASLDPIVKEEGGKQFKTGYRLTELALKTDKGEFLKLTSNLSRDLKYPGPVVGDRCRAAVEGSSLAKIKVLDSDANLKLAKNVVLDFVNYTAEKDWTATARLFTEQPTNESLQGEWANIVLKKPQTDTISFDAFNTEPLPQALKVVDVKPQQIEVLLNEDAVYSNGNAIDKFVLSAGEKGDWKIANIQRRIPRKVWHDN